LEERNEERRCFKKCDERLKSPLLDPLPAQSAGRGNKSDAPGFMDGLGAFVRFGPPLQGAISEGTFSEGVALGYDGLALSARKTKVAQGTVRRNERHCRFILSPSRAQGEEINRMRLYFE
jgi:hypothetical protein